MPLTWQTESFKKLMPLKSASFSVEAGRQCRGKLWSSLSNVCDLLKIPTVLNVEDDTYLFHHVKFKAGQKIHAAGDVFDAIFIVQYGFLKTATTDEFGNEHVHSFPMKGDVIGMEGIATKQYASDAVALSDCSLILIPFRKLARLEHEHGEFEHALYGVAIRELVRNQTMASLLGVPGAEVRVARFLILLADRYTAIGYSSTSFILRMTRQEIGSYLNMSMETVSRTLSLLSEMGLISVSHRVININDSDLLKNMPPVPPSKSRMKQLAHHIMPPAPSWPVPQVSALVN